LLWADGKGCGSEVLVRDGIGGAGGPTGLRIRVRGDHPGDVFYDFLYFAGRRCVREEIDQGNEPEDWQQGK